LNPRTTTRHITAKNTTLEHGTVKQILAQCARNSGGRSVFSDSTEGALRVFGGRYVQKFGLICNQYHQLRQT